MICLSCGHETDNSSRYCSQCGSPLFEPFQHSQLPEGTILNNKYKILSAIGQGGFGITYKGLQDEPGRFTAIKEFFIKGSRREGKKVVKPDDMAESEYLPAVEKFIEEGHILSGISHPSVVKVFDTFLENNTAYLVMELVEGKTLEDYITSMKNISDDEIKKIIIRICEGVSAIHKNNYLHRDLKPSNIIIDNLHNIKIIDFGTARNYISEHTKSMTLVLTPDYAAPEQYSKRGRFDQRTDIYAIGAIAYRMVTGQVPPDANYRMLYNHELDSGYNRVVSDRLDTIIKKCLEIKAEKRFNSCDEIIRFLNDTKSFKSQIILAEENLSAAKDYYSQGKYQDAIVEYNKAIVILNAYREEYMKSVKNYNSYKGAYISCAMCYSELKNYRKTIEYLNELIALPIADEKIYFERANAYLNLKEFTMAVKDYTKSINIYPRNPDVFLKRGYCHYMLKEYREAITDYNNAIAVSPACTAAYEGRCNVNMKLGKYYEAIRDYDKIIEINPDNNMAYYYRGLIYLKLSRYGEEARKDFEKCIKLSDWTDPVVKEARDCLRSLGY